MPEPAKDERPKAGPAPGRILSLCGERLSVHATGALWWPARALMVVSDLHLEKGTALARRGVHLPPYDSAATLDAIERLFAALTPQTVIALGDSFHDDGGPARLDDSARARIRALTAASEWLWIAGNHDPAPPRNLGGRSAAEASLGPFVFRHEPAAGPAKGEIAGHLHPAAVVAARGRRIRRRCFASDGRRLVMPALGAYAGGLNVRHPACAGLFDDPFHAWMLGREEVHPVVSRRLMPD